MPFVSLSNTGISPKVFNLDAQIKEAVELQLGEDEKLHERIKLHKSSRFYVSSRFDIYRPDFETGYEVKPCLAKH